MAESAEIKLLPDPVGRPVSVDGPVSTVQSAELQVPLEFLDAIWKAEYLERLARAYWAYLERISLGLLRVLYTPSSRTVVLLSRRLPLLRFRRPSYVTAPDLGIVTWPIERGVLVAPAGRGRGRLRISIRRIESVDVPPGHVRVRVTSEVANFYPGLRLNGPAARFGAWLYNQTQMRIHVHVTRGFLRSLANLELPESQVGSLLDDLPEAGDA